MEDIIILGEEESQQNMSDDQVLSKNKGSESKTFMDALNDFV